MAKSKYNFGSRFIVLTAIMLVAIVIASSAADSLVGRRKSSRQERSPAFQRPTSGFGDLSDYMDSKVRSHGRPHVRRPLTPPRSPKQPLPDGNTREEGPSLSCTCDEGRLTRIDRQIASLLEKTDELTTQATESRSNIASMTVNNRQLRSQVSHMMREKQTLDKQTQNLQIRVSSLTQENERVRAENERLIVELLQASAADDTGENMDETAAAEAVTNLGSSLRELNDLVGNREAELVELGLPVSVVGRPQREPEGRRGHSGGQQGGSDPDAENFASSLLAVNTDIKDMTRKVEQLERRVTEQQRGVHQDVVARPLFRQVPHQQRESEQVSEKIAQLERLVLVALGSQPGDADGERLASHEVGIDPHHPIPLMAGGRGQMRSQPGAAAREQRPYFEDGAEMLLPSPERLAIADTMSEEDLDAMANVVERVQNKSPRKCAFSVASTGITLGTDGNPLPIQFDHVFVNKGGDFQMNRNRFECEHAGFYFITFTVRSYDGKYLGVTLMKNDDIQTAIYADSSDRNVMQSQSMVAHLESGDRLWLRIAPSGKYAVHSGVHRYVTFSGFLVYRGS